MISGELRREADEFLSSRKVSLDDSQWDILDKYLGDVLEYNRKINLTAARGMVELLRRHALDSLAALKPLKWACSASRPRLLDVGAGAGFVGICLQTAWPETAVSLLESVYRKVCFLNWTSARLGLRGLKVIHGRSQGGRIYRLAPSGGKPTAPPSANTEGFDAVFARALAPLPEALALTLPLARPGGYALIFQSEKPKMDDAALDAALRQTGGIFDGTDSYLLPSENRERYLAVFRRKT